jgi:ELWxxDGT repeat protein
VKDIYPGTTGSTPANLTVFNGALYFSATDPTNGTELWRSDGTNTTLVKNISAGSASSSPAKLMAAGPYLYFNADDGSGIRVWRTDGAETIRLSDTAAANNGFVAFNDKAYFFVTNASKGIDLWQSGGTPQTTSLLKAIMPPPPPNVSPFVPRSLTVADGRLFFLADDGTTGLELWTSDGSASGTALVQDLTPGTIQGILDNQVFIFNGDVYVDGNDSVSGFEPYRFADTYAPVIWKQALSLQSVPAFTIGFNEQFVPPALSNLVLTNVTTGKQIATGMMAMSSDPATQTLRLTFPGFAHGMPPDGNYVLTFPQHTISDLKGNQNATDLVAGFFALAGDANQDRAINFADLVAVAQNYGGVGKTFAQGDFDFDGTVGFSDLVMIAQKYGTTLASPADTVGTEAVLAPLKTETKLLQSSPVQPVKKPAPVKRVSSPVFARRRI